jgi:hypothetical protein
MRITMKTAGLALAAALAVAGCGSTHSGAAVQRSALKSAEANPTVEAAVAKAKKDVINPCIDGSSGVSSFISCVKTKVPKAQRKTVGKCLVKDALADKKGHTAYQAEQELINTSAPACVAPALP